MPRWELSHSEKSARVLGILRENPGITIAELGNKCGYGKQRMRNTVILLLESGLIRREEVWKIHEEGRGRGSQGRNIYKYYLASIWGMGAVESLASPE